MKTSQPQRTLVPLLTTAALLLALVQLALADDDESLYRARPLTEAGSFTKGIEGPACDSDGNVYAVNFKRQQTIGRVATDGQAEVFLTLPGKSVGNGIRFDSAGRMLIADYVEHQVLRVDMKTKQIETLVREPAMNQPNDLTIGPGDRIYASDPNWSQGGGQVWRIEDGRAHLAAKEMGTTNGIELSPDGRLLYVNESKQRKIWSFRVSEDGQLSDKTLLTEFDDHGFDGMRCDIDGNLYVTRYGKGTVAKLSPQGKLLREIDVLGARPSNICFGGPDGRTAYVTEVEHQRLVEFRVEKPGASFKR